MKTIRNFAFVMAVVIAVIGWRVPVRAIDCHANPWCLGGANPRLLCTTDYDGCCEDLAAFCEGDLNCPGEPGSCERHAGFDNDECLLDCPGPM